MKRYSIFYLLFYISLINGFNKLIGIQSKTTIKKNAVKSGNYLKFPKFYYEKIHNMSVSMSASYIPDNNFVPDMQRRIIMNLILLGGAGVPVLWMLTGFIYFFVPPNNNNNNAGILAKDKNGDDILENEWIQSNPYPLRNLVQGLKGDAHYLIVKKDNTLENYAINAVCTHLGCVVPWNAVANKFMCPCHGSQYDETGKVIRGPAPKSLALAKTNIIDNKIILSKFEELDFRTNTEPWWN
tara:strand:- start:61 stop:780 length:720 start_codon:yes stop_codon:yes gene_type:complete